MVVATIKCVFHSHNPASPSAMHCSSGACRYWHCAHGHAIDTCASLGEHPQTSHLFMHHASSALLPRFLHRAIAAAARIVWISMPSRVIYLGPEDHNHPMSAMANRCTLTDVLSSVTVLSERHACSLVTPPTSFPPNMSPRYLTTMPSQSCKKHPMHLPCVSSNASIIIACLALHSGASRRLFLPPSGSRLLNGLVLSRFPTCKS